MTKAIGFTIDQAPKGGFKLCRITGFDENDRPVLEVIAYCSTLAESQMIELNEKQTLFGESAFYVPQRQQQPLMPASSVMPPAPEYDPGEMPRVVQDYAEGGGVMGELSRRVNGVARALLPALFLAALWTATHLRPLVA